MKTYVVLNSHTDTDDIPSEIKDYKPAVDLPDLSTGSSNNPGRLLSQAEIDALIAELTRK